MNEINKGEIQMNREEAYLLFFRELNASKKLSRKEIHNLQLKLLVVKNEISFRSKEKGYPVV